MRLAWLWVCNHEPTIRGIDLLIGTYFQLDGIHKKEVTWIDRIDDRFIQDWWCSNPISIQFREDNIFEVFLDKLMLHPQTGHVVKTIFWPRGVLSHVEVMIQESSRIKINQLTHVPFYPILILSNPPFPYVSIETWWTALGFRPCRSCPPGHSPWSARAMPAGWAAPGHRRPPGRWSENPRWNGKREAIPMAMGVPQPLDGLDGLDGWFMLISWEIPWNPCIVWMRTGVVPFQDTSMWNSDKTWLESGPIHLEIQRSVGYRWNDIWI